MFLNILAAGITLTLLDVLEDFTLDINNWTDIFLVYFPFVWKNIIYNDIVKVSDTRFDFWINYRRLMAENSFRNYSNKKKHFISINDRIMTYFMCFI